MNESKISVRYAKAFFSSAVERNLLQDAKKDVDLLLQLLQTQPRLKELLSSPVVKTKEKRVILDKIFIDRFNQLTIDFLHLLLKNNREVYLLEMCLNFQGLYSKLTGIKMAQLVTAVKLEDAQLQKFTELIQVHFGGKAEVLTKVDETLLGGFILKVEDHQYDASVSTQLKKMRREMVNVIKN
ncbi:MAG: ATP synthase F1 subunit delta [Prolixibacteraceae bacterium]